MQFKEFIKYIAPDQVIVIDVEGKGHLGEMVVGTLYKYSNIYSFPDYTVGYIYTISDIIFIKLFKN